MKSAGNVQALTGSGRRQMPVGETGGRSAMGLPIAGSKLEIRNSASDPTRCGDLRIPSLAGEVVGGWR
jgi:hypothetical protein